jgi:Uma2 family endonuclease
VAALLTPAEYLEIERPADWKSEYFQGKMVEMPHSNYRHSTIFVNLIREIFTYPDIMVICGRPQMDGDQGDIVLNPILIAEVLSEPTQDYDRGEKFQRYQNLPSLLEYITVAQDAPRVAHWTRQPDGRWTLAEAEGMDATIQLPSIGCALPLAEIQDRIDFTW